MLHLRRLSKCPALSRGLSVSENVLEHLKNRALLRVSGTDVPTFLQGLITNDINHLNSGPGSMYTMFLNTEGRVMYDSIVYKTPDENSFLIECDVDSSEKLLKHLKMYRVRRKIEITNFQADYKVYALFNLNSKDAGDNHAIADGAIVPCQQLKESLPAAFHKKHKELLIYKDPRVAHLGNRILAESGVNVAEQLSDIVKLDQNPKKNYRWLRFSLGIGEGAQDLPPGKCFPLECNCDYLHGVSFHKGCYIGQELTARVHHTGVVRKRLMPIHFTKTPTKWPGESLAQDKNNLGKLRGIEGDVGLGLLRIAKVLAIKEIAVGDGTATTFKPNWWPVEVTKEKMNINLVMEVKQEVEGEPESVVATQELKPIEADATVKSDPAAIKEEIKYFTCESCGLKEPYEYFGNDPPFVRRFKLLENCYVIEDPFGPPKQGEFIVLGTHCMKCGKCICKDSNCCLYYDGSYCINCAKSDSPSFPQNIQDKLNKIIAH